MRNIIILAFVALMCACLMSQANPNTFKLINHDDEYEQTFIVTFKDTNSPVRVDIITLEQGNKEMNEYIRFATIQDVIVFFEAKLMNDYFYLEMNGKKYLFNRERKGYGYTYTVTNESEKEKHNVNPFSFIKGKLNKKPKKESDTAGLHYQSIWQNNVAGRF